MNKALIFIIISTLIVSGSIASSQENDYLIIHSQEDLGTAFEQLEGEKYLMVINTNDEEGSHWFLIDGYHNQYLGAGLGALHTVNSLSASWDNKYLAVITYGEGHSFLEIIDLPKFLEKKQYAVLQSIDPYPGGISINSWDKDQIIKIKQPYLS